MASKAWSATRVADVVSSGRASAKGRDQHVCLHVVVDPAAPRELVCAVRDLLVPERANVEVRVYPLSEAPAGEGGVDAVVALVSPGPDARLVACYAGAGTPVALVVEGALEAPSLSLDERAAALVSVVAASSPKALSDKLASWLASATEKGLALAAGLPFCRAAVSDVLVARCALENAAIGLVRLVPGSDLPLMTANQVKLALDIAAAHGRSLEPARALEIAGVMGGGLCWRALSRGIVSLVPGLGALARAGVAYAGTRATGAALRLRFGAGARPPLAPSAHASGTREASLSHVLLESAARDADELDGYVTIGGCER